MLLKYLRSQLPQIFIRKSSCHSRKYEYITTKNISEKRHFFLGTKDIRARYERDI